MVKTTFFFRFPLLIQIFPYHDYSKSVFTCSCFKTFLHSISGDDSHALLMFTLLFLHFYWKYLIWLSYNKTTSFFLTKALITLSRCLILYFMLSIFISFTLFSQDHSVMTTHSPPWLAKLSNPLSDMLIGSIINILQCSF